MAVTMSTGTNIVLSEAATSTSTAVAVPGDIADGDSWLVIGAKDDDPVASPPAGDGWTEVGTPFGSAAGDDRAIGAWIKNFATAPTGTVTFTHDNEDTVFLSFAVKGADTSTFVSGAWSAQADQDTDAPTCLAPGAGGATGDLTVCVIGAASGAGGARNPVIKSMSPPTGMTSDTTNSHVPAVATAGGDCSLAVAWEAYVDDTSHTWSGGAVTDTDWATATFVLKAAAVTASADQTDFRFRVDDNVGLNAAFVGGDPAQNIDLTYTGIDTECRLRIGIEQSDASRTDGYKLQYSYEGGAWTAVPDNATPWAANSADGQKRIQLVPDRGGNFTNGAATTSLLTGMTGTFVAGEGRETNTTGSITLDAGERTELEWVVLIRKLSDDGHTADTDTFDFRVVLDDNTALENYTETPRLTIGNRSGHIGGTAVETPMHVLAHYPANDTLYALVENADTNGRLTLMRSTNRGAAWLLCDGANRPTATDIEGGSMVVDGDDLHIAWQDGGDQEAYYTVYDMSTNQWNGGSAASVETVTSGTSAGGDQCVDIAVRSDGVVWLSYMGDDGSGNARSFVTRRSGGTWQTAIALSTVDDAVYGATMVKDYSNDTVHVVYCADDTSVRTMYHQKLDVDSLDGARVAITSNLLVDAGAEQPMGPMKASSLIVFGDGSNTTESILLCFADAQEDPTLASLRTDQASSWTIDQATTENVDSNAGGSGCYQIDVGPTPWYVENEIWWVQDSGSDDTLLRRKRRNVFVWEATSTQYDGVYDIGVPRLIGFQYSSGTENAVTGALVEELPVLGGTGGMFYEELVRGVPPRKATATPAATAWSAQVATLAVAAPVSFNASPAATTWAAQPATLTEAGLTFDAAPAATSWSAQPATLSGAALTFDATPAATSWAAQPATLTEAPITITAAPAVTSWTVPGASLIEAGLTFDATPAATAWSAQPATFTEDPLTVTATPAVSTWSTQPATLTEAGLTFTASPAATAWSTQVATLSTLGDTVVSVIAGGGGDYATIQDAVNAADVTSGRWIIEIEDASLYTEAVDVTGVTGTPSATNYVWIRATTNKHAGVFGTGHARTTWTSTNLHAFRIRTDYTRISDLQIVSGYTGSRNAVRVDGGVTGVLIERCLLENTTAGENVVACDATGAHGVSIDNSVLISNSGAGVYLPFNSPTAGAKTLNVDHSSFIGGAGNEDRAIVFRGYSGTPAVAIVGNVYNCAMESSTDAVIQSSSGTVGSNTLTLNGSHNLHCSTATTGSFTADNTTNWQDASTGGLTTTTTTASAWIVTDLTDGVENLTPVPATGAGSNLAIDTGTNRIGSEPDARQDFSIDISGASRPTTGVEIGAFVATAFAAIPATTAWSVPGAALTEAGLTFDAAPAVTAWSVQPATLTEAPATFTASPAATVWAAQPATFTEAGLLVAATPAATVWSVPGASLVAAGLTFTATPAATSWSVQPATMVEAATSFDAVPAATSWAAQPATISVAGSLFTASPATTAWSVPGAAFTEAPTTITASPAVTAWSVVPAVLTEAGLSFTASPAATTWSAVPATLTVGAGAIVASPAATAWSVPGAGFSSAGLVFSAAPAVTLWSVPGAALTGAGTTVAAAPAVTSWSTMAATFDEGALIIAAEAAATAWSVPGAGFSTPFTLSAAPAVTAWSTISAVFAEGSPADDNPIAVTFTEAPKGYVFTEHGVAVFTEAPTAAVFAENA